MRATVLTDNTGNNGLAGEWGLSFYIEYRDQKILLDAGQSGLFAENAEKLGIDLADTDYAVLSHAHYDHADGMPVFLEKNRKAKLYVRESCGENCYDRKEGRMKYIGIKRGLLEAYKDRITYVSGDCEPGGGVWLISHSRETMEEAGKREHMYLKEGDEWAKDCFAHEQSLVFEEDSGLVIFNSCSHGGAANIINEVSAAFPGRKIRAMIGGFHLYNKSEQYVRALTEKLRATGVEEIYTGHCTGEEGYRIMRDVLGNMVHPLEVGLRIVL